MKKDEDYQGIIISNDGLYYKHWKDDGFNKQSIKSYLPYLNEVVFFEDDTKFKNFFQPIIDEIDQFSIIFAGQLGRHDLNDWLAEWNTKNKTVEDGDDDIDYVEFYWHVEKDEDSLEQDCSFHGVGRTRNSSSYGDYEWHDTKFSFGLSPIFELKKYIIKINNEFKILDYNIKFDKNNPDGQYIFTSKLNMTLYDIIGAFLFEISWYGAPKSRQKVCNNLNKQIEIIKNDTEEELIKFKSIDELFKHLKDGEKE